MNSLFETESKETADHYRDLADLYVLLHSDRRLVIFGAGMCGLFMGKICAEKGLDFIYTDNNADKWNTKIYGKKVVSPQDLLNDNRYYYIVSATGSGADEICRFLDENGLRAEADYLCVKDIGVDNIISAVQRRDDRRILVLGDCYLTSVSCNEKDPSIKDLLEKAGCIVLSLANMNMAEYYYLYEAMRVNNTFSILNLLLDVATFSHIFSRLPRAQHVNLWERIEEAAARAEGFKEFYETQKKRAKSSFIDLMKTDRNEEYSDEINRKNKIVNTKMNYLFQIKEGSEEIAWLNKIIESCRRNEIKCNVFILPVNFREGDELLQGKFTEIYDNLRRRITDKIDRPDNCEIIDLSFLLAKSEFVSIANLNEAYRSAGREKITQKVLEYCKG